MLDAVTGDPEWMPHPVRLIGLVISNGESLLRSRNRSASFNLLAGGALTLSVVGGTYYLSKLAIDQLAKRSTLAANGLELLLSGNCLAARNLRDEASSVVDALDLDDLSKARLQLSRIVGRDTEGLSAVEISRAVIETVAESISDGIVAPMFYLAIGGMPLAMAYKAVNTLDSMIGHRDVRYKYFGKFAARLDDLANIIPSRLSALAIVASAPLMGGSGSSALRTWVRDSGNHKSPNAGQPESAMSGALRVRLGGDNVYAGELLPSPIIGSEFALARPIDARRSLKFIVAATLLMLGAGMLINGYTQLRRASESPA